MTEDDGITEGVLVLGAPRSGTTLLRRLLDAHPSFACPGEIGVFRAAARFLEGEVTGVGVAVGVRAGLRHAGFEDPVILARVRELAFSFMEEVAQRAGKQRWVEKNAFDAFFVERIAELCQGRVRFVCLVRHGLDAAASMHELAEKSGSYLLDFHDYLKRFQRPLEAFSHAWVDINRELLALSRREPERTLLVKYEELVGDPTRELERILEFLGEDMPPGLIDRALGQPGSVGLGDWKTYGRDRIDNSSIDRWKALPVYAVSLMGRISNPILRELGYGEVPVEEADLESLRRRYELGLLLNRARSAPRE